MKTLGNTTANSFSSITLSNGVSFVTITAPPTGIYIISLPPNIGTPGQFLQTDGAGSTSWQTVPAGTVTSVALTVPSFLTVTGSPITNSGTFNVTLTPNSPLPVSSGGTGITDVGLPGSLLFTGPLLEYEWEPPGLAGQVLTMEVVGPLLLPSWKYPTTGTVTTVSASVPSFLSVTVTNPTTTPAIGITYNTGTALPFANGGTGLTTLGLAGQVLTSTGTVMNWATPLITAASTDFSIPLGVLNLSTAFKATISAIEGDIIDINTELGLIATDLLTINNTLYNPVTGLDTIVIPGILTSILALGLDITSLGNKTISMNVPSFLSVTGSPVTLNSNGGFTVSYSGTALPTTSGGTGLTTVGTNGQVLTSNGTTLSWQTNGTGTVSSVAATVPSFLSIAGSPITSTGTLAITYSGTALPTANGGTGSTSASTGTGGVVLATSPTLVTPILGAATASSIVVSGLTNTNSLQVNTPGVVSSQGCHIQWNRGPDGATWILNQKGLGGGGIIFAKVTTGNVATEQMRILENDTVKFQGNRVSCLGATNPGFELRTPGNDWGYATAGAAYCSNAAVGDSILRATGRLLLVSGVAISAIVITPALVTLPNYGTSTRSLLVGSGGTATLGQISISASTAGQARYHLSNNGGVCEWTMGQANGTSHEFRISSIVASVGTTRFSISDTGVVAIPNLTTSTLVRTNGASELISVPAGVDGQVLSLVSSIPTWTTVSGVGTVTSVSLNVDSTLSGLFTNTGSATITSSGTFTLSQAASPTITLGTSDQFNVSKSTTSSSIPNLNIDFGAGPTARAIDVFGALSIAGVVISRYGRNSGTGNHALLEYTYVNSNSASNRFIISMESGQSIDIRKNTITASILTVTNLLTASAGISTTTLTTSGLLTASAGISTTTLTASGLLTASADLSATTSATDGILLTSSIGGGIKATCSSGTTGAITFKSFNSVAAISVPLRWGRGDGNGDSANLSFTYNGANNTTNSTGIGFTGGSGAQLTLFNDPATNTTLNTPLSLTTTGAAALKFSTALQNRKIVLYNIGSNDHQYYGMGVTAGIFRYKIIIYIRYQIPTTADNHIFYAGTGTTTSDEILRIRGTKGLTAPYTNLTNSISVGNGNSRAQISITGTGNAR